jgi:hypothetical protein
MEDNEERYCVEIAGAIYNTMLNIYDIDEIILSGKFDDEASRLADIRRAELENLRGLHEIFDKCMV